MTTEQALQMMENPGIDPVFGRICMFRDGGNVRRSHTLRTLKERTVAEHSHGVAMLARQAYICAGKTPPSDVICAALVHDLSEVETGDVPSPTKRRYPDIKKSMNEASTAWEYEFGLRYPLNDEEKLLLRWCDYMEFGLFAVEEVTMGNRFFEVYLCRIIQWLKKLTPDMLTLGEPNDFFEKMQSSLETVALALLGRDPYAIA